MVSPAHLVAWEKANVLHRDISVNNILIDIYSLEAGDPQGILADWGLSKSAAKGELGPRTQHSRSVCVSVMLQHASTQVPPIGYLGVHVGRVAEISPHADVSRR